ncbi:MAG: squalene/phytoene synthase family protein [Anaerolineales bacterium]|jgi:phytoene/squalene synthetase
MVPPLPKSQSIAASITKAASKQTYYTIRIFADRERVEQAYQAYGYFRWVDDILDEKQADKPGKIAFIQRQKSLLQACYRGVTPERICPEEQMLLDLVHHDDGSNPGLRSYLDNMMAVLEFDATRRGELISQAELDQYSQSLAVAVSNALFYFIGHDDPPPGNKSIYRAVNAAHIVHMLRDTLDDNQLGYFNIPREYLQDHKLSPSDLNNQAYQAWVCSRVKLARKFFEQGCESLAEIKNVRCKMVGYAYTARFEWMLRAIERDNFCLRSEYNERRGLPASLWIIWKTLSAAFSSSWVKGRFAAHSSNPVNQ